MTNLSGAPFSSLSARGSSYRFDERDENGHVIGAFTDQSKACHQTED